MYRKHDDGVKAADGVLSEVRRRKDGFRSDLCGRCTKNHIIWHQHLQ